MEDVECRRRRKSRASADRLFLRRRCNQYVMQGLEHGESALALIPCERVDHESYARGGPLDSEYLVLRESGKLGWESRPAQPSAVRTAFGVGLHDIGDLERLR